MLIIKSEWRKFAIAKTKSSLVCKVGAKLDQGTRNWFSEHFNRGKELIFVDIRSRDDLHEYDQCFSHWRYSIAHPFFNSCDECTRSLFFCALVWAKFICFTFLFIQLGSGRLGSSLIKCLLEEGYIVHSLDLFEPRTPIPFCIYFKGNHVHFNCFEWKGISSILDTIQFIDCPGGSVKDFHLGDWLFELLIDKEVSLIGGI